jgi:hypothetical protein
MIFKEAKYRDQLFAAHTVLIEIAKEFELISMTLGIEPVVTRVSDHFDGESGVHLYGRGLDFRNEHNGTKLYTEEQVNLICDRINAKFKRYDGRPTILHHGFNGGPEHFHVQVAANFMAYKEAEVVKDDGQMNIEDYKEVVDEQLEESTHT